MFIYFEAFIYLLDDPKIRFVCRVPYQSSPARFQAGHCDREVNHVYIRYCFALFY